MFVASRSAAQCSPAAPRCAPWYPMGARGKALSGRLLFPASSCHLSRFSVHSSRPAASLRPEAFFHGRVQVRCITQRGAVRLQGRNKCGEERPLYRLPRTRSDVPRCAVGRWPFLPRTRRRSASASLSSSGARRSVPAPLILAPSFPPSPRSTCLGSPHPLE